jgi:hypothetical protein
MLEKDIKILWGRSGNRCAICKIELTPDGNDYTLGEMAHIVARSVDGPRGNEDLPLDQRELYSNLILLCPNHHKEIDKNPNQWNRQELLNIKNEHETWVSKQLELGHITITSIDNTSFIKSRIDAWRKFSLEEVWIISSLTPLVVSEEFLNPLNENVINNVNKILVPTRYENNEPFNPHHTRPNDNGLINDDLRRRDQGYGHSFQIFRNGHCEFMVNIQDSINQTTEYAQSSKDATVGSLRVIRYTAVANSIKKEFIQLRNIWKSCLSLKNMMLNIILLNTQDSIMYSKERVGYGPLYGFPVQSEFLRYTNIIEICDDDSELLFLILSRFCNYYGLVLEQLYDDKGEFMRPERVHPQMHQ